MQRYERFRDEQVRIHLVQTDADARTLARELERLRPAQIGLDFETAANRGFGVMNGSLRLVQIGIDDLHGHARPRQVIVDCFRADPRPLRGLLAAPAATKLIHNAPFERTWAGVHLNTPIQSIYDTCAAWKVIQKHLGQMPREQAQLLLSGWEPHDNKLATLVERYLQMTIPKDGQRSDWSRERLTDSQLVYAAVDVAVLGELARLTRQVAARLGLTDLIAQRSAEADERAWKRTREVIAEREDDRERVRRALERADDVGDLERLWSAARQMTLTGQSRDDLDHVFERTRQRIVAGGGPAPAATMRDAAPF